MDAEVERVKKEYEEKQKQKKEKEKEKEKGKGKDKDKDKKDDEKKEEKAEEKVIHYQEQYSRSLTDSPTEIRRSHDSSTGRRTQSICSSQGLLSAADRQEEERGDRQTKPGASSKPQPISPSSQRLPLANG